MPAESSMTSPPKNGKRRTAKDGQLQKAMEANLRELEFMHKRVSIVKEWNLPTQQVIATSWCNGRQSTQK